MGMRRSADENNPGQVPLRDTDTTAFAYAPVDLPAVGVSVAPGLG